MISRDEAYDIIQNLNEIAHQYSWDLWIEADELMESNSESDWEAAEDIREEASLEQSSSFREGFENLDDDTKTAILNYVDQDEDFKEDFVTWYGRDEYEADFG